MAPDFSSRDMSDGGDRAAHEAPTLPAEQDDRSQWRDGATYYGWVSILLHWITVAAIFALLFAGDSIAFSGDNMLRIHTSIAVLAYIPLLVRTVWRWQLGHPRHVRKGSRISHGLSILCHYVMLAALLIMLVSGPLMASAGRVQLRVFDWFVMPGLPLPADWFAPLLRIHVWGAQLLVYAILLHIAAVLKHVIWNRDGTFGRIMAPPLRTHISQRMPRDDIE